jgi:hypothetical protein
MTGWTQKGMVSRLIGHIVDGRSLAMRPGIKHRPNVTRNGCAEQSNPFDALQKHLHLQRKRRYGAGNQPQAQTGEIAQEAKAPGKARGYADVGTENRKVKVLAEVVSYGRRANSY